MSKKNEYKNENLEEFKKQSEEYLNGWKRAKADLMNFQRETEKQKENWIKFANKNLILALLPLCDNFDEALKYAPEEKSVFLEGIKQIKKQLDDLLKEFGAEKIKSLGEKFNPEIHESMVIEESEEESGIIVKEIQTGYKLNDKILRPSKVAVAK